MRLDVSHPELGNENLVCACGECVLIPTTPNLIMAILYSLCCMRLDVSHPELGNGLVVLDISHSELVMGILLRLW